MRSIHSAAGKDVRAPVCAACRYRGIGNKATIMTQAGIGILVPLVFIGAAFITMLGAFFALWHGRIAEAFIAAVLAMLFKVLYLETHSRYRRWKKSQNQE